ncbi:MAG: hypothetical protein VYE73_16885 [Acidobacteriota bacterium]|nr:hypothetical protein [Acidobacteriota bacterium]
MLAPMAMSSGTMQPNRPRGVTVVEQIVFALLVPVAVAPTTIPLAIEMLVGLLREGGGSPPIYLILTILELPAVWWIYRKALTFQGSLLGLRERQILEVVTKTA